MFLFLSFSGLAKKMVDMLKFCYIIVCSIIKDGIAAVKAAAY